MRQFFDDLRRLEELLAEMAGMVRSSIHESVLSLEKPDVVRARNVIENDVTIDQMEIRIDELATTLMALNQPVASDMRLIVAALKINTDLERMGDLASNIAQSALKLSNLPTLDLDLPMSVLGASVEGMVERSLDAFVDRDADLAREVLRADSIVDKMRDDIYETVTPRIEDGRVPVRTALGYLSATRNLERIADHATNIAEDVIFLVRGVDVRHSKRTGWYGSPSEPLYVR